MSIRNEWRDQWRSGSINWPSRTLCPMPLYPSQPLNAYSVGGVKAQTALLKYVTSRPSNPLQSPTMLKTTCPSTLNYGSMKRRLLVCSTFTTLKSIVTVDYTALTFVQPDSPRSERLRSKAKFLRSSDLHGDLFVGCKAVNVLCYAAAKALPKAKPCAVLQTPQG